MKGSRFRHLGVSIGGQCAIIYLIEWIDNKSGDKFMHRKTQSWGFHTQLQVVQFIMEPMILYFLLSLPWFKKRL